MCKNNTHTQKERAREVIWANGEGAVENYRPTLPVPVWNSEQPAFHHKTFLLFLWKQQRWQLWLDPIQTSEPRRKTLPGSVSRIQKCPSSSSGTVQSWLLFGLPKHKSNKGTLHIYIASYLGSQRTLMDIAAQPCWEVGHRCCPHFKKV